jgi:hypothetical protein
MAENSIWHVFYTKIHDFLVTEPLNFYGKTFCFKMAEKNKKKNDIFQKNSRFFYGETAE